MKNKEVNEQIVYGLIPSKLDGTEQVFEFDNKIEIPQEYSWQDVMPPIRNQGNTYTCVCQSLTCILDFIKNSEEDTAGECNNFSINELYNMRSNKPQEGMSIKEGMELLKTKGLNGMKINSYALIPSVEACKMAILMFGPVAIGSLVYDSNRTDYWRKTTNHNLGGHCGLLVGWDKKNFILRNSWGKSYGKGGYAKMSFDDFNEYVIEAWTATI